MMKLTPGQMTGALVVLILVLSVLYVKLKPGMTRNVVGVAALVAVVVFVVGLVNTVRATRKILTAAAPKEAKETKEGMMGRGY
jgi:protein-S-isoprenylcysteine O-methyltransferase Ste14